MRIDLPDAVVRPFRAADAASLAVHANNRSVWRNLFDKFPHPYTAADAEAYLAGVVGVEPETQFAIDIGGEVVGGIGFRPRADVERLTASIGYWLGEPYWGRGIATAALRAVTGYAIERHGLVRVEARVFEWNPASARVLEKAGYALECRARRAVFKDGRVIDALQYAYVVGPTSAETGQSSQPA